MRILHLSDLHYGAPSHTKFTDDKVLEALFSSLENYKNNIDIVIFSGDLVNNGENSEDFENAKKYFLEPVARALNIDQNRIILTCGNHDVDRSSAFESLDVFFETKITSSEELNKFAKNNSKDFQHSLDCLKNYNSFVKNYYTDSSKLDSLYSIHKFNVGNELVGILSLNSSWRAVKKDANGKLLFPTCLLQEALIEMKDCSCRVVITHHPLFHFNGFNYLELQKNIHKEFDMIFFGHIHQQEINTHYAHNNGIYATATSASLTYDKRYIGYSIHDYDSPDKDEVNFVEVKYFPETGSFQESTPVVVPIPRSKEKDNQNRIRNKIVSKINLELKNGKDLLLNLDIDDNNEDVFIDLFKNPILKTSSKTNLTSSETQATFDFGKLLDNENSYLIFGSDKSGKSSLLKYIQIHHLKHYSTSGIIPFYMDFKELNPSIDSRWSMINHMSKYFELNKEDTKGLIEKCNFRLFVDNFDPKSHLYKLLESFLVQFPSVNFVACSDHLASREISNYSFGEREYQRLFLHDITRKEVRQYANSYLEKALEDKDQLIDKIVSFCKQLELPLNYWTVSIILLIHEKSKFDLSKNLYKLLDLSVDEILEKKFLTLTKTRIEFDQLKELCGKLACELLLKHQSHSYAASRSDIFNFIDLEVKKNIRLTADTQEILQYLFDTGVLKEKDNQLIGFRLNGIFEYFVALNMSKDSVLTDQILEDDNVYLSFKNEIEIYSGIKNGDIEILERVYEKTKKYFQQINMDFEKLGEPDTILKQLNVDETSGINLKEMVKTIQPALLDEETQDIIKDEANPIIHNAVALKKMYDTTVLTPEIYERYIAILARVFRTMDKITDEELLRKVLDFLLKTYTNFGFFLIREFQDEFREKGETDLVDDERNNILLVLNKFLPLLVQITFSDGITHHNIERIVLNKIEELKINPKNNQYYMFILYLILMDIDDSNIFRYADELISFAKIGILKYSTIMKLNYYFSFKANRNKNLEQFLKLKIADAQMKLDDKTDKSSLQRGLERRSKANLLKE